MPSTVIRRFDYRPAERVLEVTFTTGRQYRYLSVPGSIYQEMKGAYSKGEFFNRHIRDHFAFEKIG